MNQDDISLDNGRTEQDRFPAAPARGRNIEICFDCWDVSTQIALEAVEKVHQKRKPVFRVFQLGTKKKRRERSVQPPKGERTNEIKR